MPELLDQLSEGDEIGIVTADGAHETRRCHTAIIDQQATAIIPIRKNGRPWKEDCPAAIARNETLRATRHHVTAFWKRWTGYHAHTRIEAKMRCIKAFGECIAARHPDRQTAEIQIRVAPSTASTPPRSSEWPDINRERNSLASGLSHATMPIETHPGALFLPVGFIVTNLPMKPGRVVGFYTQRGTASPSDASPSPSTRPCTPIGTKCD